MKTAKFNIMLAAAALVAVCLSANAQDKVVYTGEIAKKVIGYNGPTPLNITINKGKITKIEVLDNEESPRYLDKAKAKVFPQFIGKTVSEALKVKADIASGATYTSNALIENIRLGLQQAQKNAVKPAKKATKKAGKKVIKKKHRRR
jgi:uncharacterized protein with FMN-binding domain